MAYVYIHRKKTDSKIFYVGIGSDDKYKRANWKYQRNEIWTRIYKKHGIEVEITHDNIIWEEACAIEIYLIEFYGRLCNDSGILANITEGGEGNFGLKHTEETKKRISNLKKGRKLTKEHIEIIRAVAKKQKGIKKGKQKKERNEEYRSKLSAAAISRKNTKHTDEWKLNQKIKMTGRKTNKTLDGILVFNKEGVISHYFDSISVCSNELNISKFKIRRNLNGILYNELQYSFNKIPKDISNYLN